MTCGRIQELMVEALYRELDDERAREFDAHIAGCAECAALYADMRATAAHVHERHRPDPGDAYWNNYYQRLEERMDRERSVIDSSPMPARRRSYVSWGYRVAAAVAVLAMGVWLGRSSIERDRTREQPGINVAENVPADSVRERPIPADSLGPRSLPGAKHAIDNVPADRTPPESTAKDNVVLASADVRAHNYIERSQVLLLALVNAMPDSSEATFESRRERAGLMVQEAGLLRDDLPGSDNRRLRELVTDLQMILREIANLESETDVDGVEIIKNRVDREGVLLKIDVEQMRGDEGKKTQPKRSGAID